MARRSYRVLLVEDEISIREGIRDIIEWERLGFHFAAEANNGREALEIFDRIRPDLVITDIRMPQCGGLELIAAVRERSRETKVVIITGFADFDYARQAIKLNVKDYLLKPVSPGELTALLKQLKAELDEAAGQVAARPHNGIADRIVSHNQHHGHSSLTTAEQAKAYIESHYMRSSLALEDLCSRLAVSPSTLSRIFKAHLHTTFSSYLRDVRIRAAKELIRRTDMRGKEIAYQVGFNSPHYFSHVFITHAGCSPSEYRRNLTRGRITRR